MRVLTLLRPSEPAHQSHRAHQSQQNWIALRTLALYDEVITSSISRRSCVHVPVSRPRIYISRPVCPLPPVWTSSRPCARPRTNLKLAQHDIQVSWVFQQQQQGLCRCYARVLVCCEHEPYDQVRCLGGGRCAQRRGVRRLHGSGWTTTGTVQPCAYDGWRRGPGSRAKPAEGPARRRSQL